MEKWKVFEALKWASSFLKKHHREEKVGEILLCYHLQMERTGLFQNMSEPLSAAVQERFVNDVRAHVEGVPVQHLTGEERFYGRTFSVNPDVLIPRPETEELVAVVLVAMADGFPVARPLQVVDVGTGSGAIAITLALEDQRLTLSAVDVSREALRTAERNARKFGVTTIDFYQGDLLVPLIEKQESVDVIISNPPYIPEKDFRRLDPLVRDHEPHLALNGGDDGLRVYRRLIAQLPDVIEGPALVAFEVGVEQSREVARLLEDQWGRQAEISIKKDINGKERIVLAKVF